MAPVPGEPSSSAKIALKVLIYIVGVFLGAISPLLAVGIWMYCSELWRFMVTKRSRYLEFEKARKRWNKVALMEQRRRNIAGHLVRDMINDRGKSEEDFFLYLEMAQRAYFPARTYYRHQAILSLTRLWKRVQYKLFKSGYYKDFSIRVEEWDEAVARARGGTENQLDDFAAIFWDVDPPTYESVARATGSIAPRYPGV